MENFDGSIGFLGWFGTFGFIVVVACLVLILATGDDKTGDR